MLGLLKKILNLFQKRQSTILSAAILIMLSYGISMLLGLIRERLLVTYFFGCCKTDLDVYYAAFRLPDTLFQLLVTGSLSAAFIPVFSQLVEKDLKKAYKVASTVLSGLISSFLVLGTIIFLFAPQLSALITGSFSSDQIVLMAKFTRIMLMAQFFFLFSSFMTGLIQSHHRFLLPALAPVVYNLSIIFGIVFLTDRLGIYAPVVGVVGGSLLHAGLQIPLAKKLGFNFKWNWNFKQREVKEIIRLMIPRTLSSGIGQFEATVAMWFATSLISGSLVIFSLAQMLMNLPIRLIGVPISQASFPLLSKVAKKDNFLFSKMVVENLLQILYLILPITTILLILRIPIVRLAYGAANFPWNATLLTGRTLALFVLAIPTQAVVQLLNRCFYARKDTKIPLWAGSFSMLTFLGLSFMLVFKLNWGVLGLAASASVASFVQVTILLILLNKKVKILTQQLVVPIIKLFFTTLLMSTFLWIPMRFLDNFIFDTTRVLPLMGLTVMATSIGLAVYFSLCYWLKVKQQEKMLILLQRLPAMRKSMEKLRTLVSISSDTTVGIGDGKI